MRLTAAFALRAACALAIGFATGFAAAPAFAAVHPQSVCAKEEAENELGKLMGQMGRKLKELKKEVGDPDQKEANLARFAKIAELAEQCKAHAPDTVKTDADKKAYADGLDQTAAIARAGAEAVKAGKTEEAKKACADLIKNRDAGHKKFKKED